MARDVLIVRLRDVLHSWFGVAAGLSVGDSSQATSLAGRDLVGAVAAVRGTWWGVVILRCDRGLAAVSFERLHLESMDSLLRRLSMVLTHEACEEIDPRAKRSSPVVLGADNGGWVPEFAWLQAQVEVNVADWLARVEVHRRRRSDEMPQVGSDSGSSSVGRPP